MSREPLAAAPFPLLIGEAHRLCSRLGAVRGPGLPGGPLLQGLPQGEGCPRPRQRPQQRAPHQRTPGMGAAAHHLPRQRAEEEAGDVRVIGLRFYKRVYRRHLCSQYDNCLFSRHFHKLPSLLSSDDVNMRIAAGETLALLLELARGMESVSTRRAQDRVPITLLGQCGGDWSPAGGSPGGPSPASRKRPCDAGSPETRGWAGQLPDEVPYTQLCCLLPEARVLLLRGGARVCALGGCRHDASS